MLNHDAGKPIVDFGQHRLELRDIEPRALTDINAEMPAIHLPAERQPLQIEEPRRALQIG